MAVETLTEDRLSPAERRRLKVRDAIIEAAEAIFSEEGEAGLSMRRIAERIDYSPAALYKYFESKEALFREIRESFFERVLTRMQDVCADIEQGPLLCTKCMRAYVLTGLEQPAHYKLAFTGFPEDNDPEEETYAFAAAGHLHQMIKQSIEEGWFRDMDLEVAAKSVWAASHGLTSLAVTIPNFPAGLPGFGTEAMCKIDPTEGEVRTQLETLISFHAQMLMRGLGTPKLIERLDAGETF